MILLPSPIEEILRSWIEIAPFKLPLGRVESPLSDSLPPLVYQYAHKERPAERARIGLRRETRARDVFSRRPDFMV